MPDDPAIATPEEPFLLHVVPDSVANEDKAFLGSTKDIGGREDYFGARAIRVVTLPATKRSDAQTLQEILALDLTYCAAVLFEFETYRQSLHYLATYRPEIRLIVRAHNANLPHYVDQLRGFALQGDTMRAQRAADQTLDRLAEDMATMSYADVVLSISAWESANYWSVLAPAAEVLTMPFFMPARFGAQIERGEKERLCVCLMGTGYDMTGLLYGAGKTFVELVTAADGRLAHWDFAVTGRLDYPDILGPLGRISSTGLLPSPLPVLAKSKAIAILSDWGGGFKTKILEAILAGNWVIVTREIFDRLPEPVRPWCIAISSLNADGFVEALARADGPVPDGDPNPALRAAAFAAMDEALAGLPLATAQRAMAV